MPRTVLGQIKTDSSNLYYKAIWYPKKGKVSIDSAISYFEKQSTQSLNNNDTIKAIKSLRSLAQGYFKKGAIFESELSVVKTFKLLEDMPSDSFNIATRKALSVHLGILYRKIDDYNSAIKYYNLALELSKSSRDSIRTLNNLANIYTDMEEYHLAVNTLNLVYKKIESIKDYKNRWTVIDNLGYNQSKIHISGALDKMKLALNMRLEEGDIEGAFSSYRHLTYYYIDRKKEFDAQKYAFKANDIANYLSLPTFKLEALRLNALLNKDIETREFVRLSDSMNMAKKLSDNKYANKKYSYEKQEKIANDAKLKLKDSKLKNQRQKTTNLIYLFSGILVLIASIFLHLRLKSKHKKDKIREAYLKETELSKKVHDELANDMSDLMNFVENDIDASETKKSLLLDNIENIYLRTRDISTETGSIDLIHFSKSLSNLLLQHNREGTKILINDIDTINWKKVPDHKKVIVYRCLQELMINMKKHSHAKLVSIMFKEHNSKKEIRYVDDGIGVSIEQVKLNGLLNVESRIKSVQGTFNFVTSRGNGFKATLEFNS